MSHLRKSFWSLLFVLVFLVTACTPAATPTAAPATAVPPADVPTAAVEQPTVEATKPEEKVTLRFASWQWGEPGFGDFYREAAEGLHELNPNITVEEYSLPVDQYFDKMLTEVQSGSPADLIMLRGSLYPQYVAMGALEPLDDRLAQTDIIQRWDPAQTTVLKIDGKTYGLLMMTRNYQMVYNKAAFKEAGIDKFPETPEEFYEATVALTRKDAATGEQKYGLAFPTTVNDYGFYEGIMLWVNCYGGNFAKDGKITATDPNTIKGLEFMKRMFDAKVTPLGITFSEQQQRIIDGNLGMLVGGPFVYPFLEKLDAEKVKNIDFGGTPCPNHTSTGGPQNVIVIPAAAKNKDAAWEYIKFIAQPEWQAKFPELTFSQPGMEGAMSADFAKQYPWFKIFSDAAPYTISISPPGFEIYQSEWQRIVGEKVEQMFYNNLPPEQVAQDIQTALEEFVAEKNK
ncbi:MAG: sugar ABC transporter substrate-binding protein [Anaerolineaceae bacterium]|nr:sugar ABC transporter substrate-binding protein [Anaerolineaceae bacterium]